MPATTRQQGFTLIELMLAITILSVVMAFGVPSFIQVTKNNNLISTTNDIVSLLNYARAEAVRRSTTVTVTTTNGSGSNEWGAGSEVAAGLTTLRELPPADPAITADGQNNVTLITFDSAGLTNLAMLETILICDDRAGETGRRITILVSGIIDVQSFSCS